MSSFEFCVLRSEFSILSSDMAFWDLSSRNEFRGRRGRWLYKLLKKKIERLLLLVRCWTTWCLRLVGSTASPRYSMWSVTILSRKNGEWVKKKNAKYWKWETFPQVTPSSITPPLYWIELNWVYCTICWQYYRYGKLTRPKYTGCGQFTVNHKCKNIVKVNNRRVMISKML